MIKVSRIQGFEDNYEPITQEMWVNIRYIVVVTFNEYGGCKIVLSDGTAIDVTQTIDEVMGYITEEMRG